MSLESRSDQRDVSVRIEPEPSHDEPLVFDSRIDTAHQSVAIEEGTDIPAPTPLRGWFVHLPYIVEVEDRADQIAIPYKRIQRPQNAYAIIVSDP